MGMLQDKKMNEQEIRDQIKDVEEKLKADIILLNYDYYDKLLDIHKKLWDLLYFKLNQEKTFLVK